MSHATHALNSPLTVPAVKRGLVPGGATVGIALILVAAVYLGVTIHARQAALFLIGVLAGLVLYHAAFGFTSAWRVLIADGRGAGLRAQMLMLAATSLVFFPLLSAGELFGQPVRGSVSPAGLPVVFGAFMFGVGMQLGGGCASGTLYTVGGGNSRMVVTLLMFIVGSVIGTAHAAWWTTLPAFSPVSIVTALGPAAALVVSLGVFGAIAALSIAIERRRHGSVESTLRVRPRAGESADDTYRRWLRGPWPLVAGAIGLAMVNIATLVLAGRPWGVTSAFALWGAKAASAIGVPVASWPYWSTPAQKAALESNVLIDVTTVMNIGIMLGAMTAAMLASRFAPTWRTSARSLAAAVIGGLLLGYGARVAYGCNIGAYFSGIASGSPHGWLWMAAAFAGNALGVRLRPMCDLPVERSSRRG